MKKEKKKNNQVNKLTISPVNGFVHFRVDNAEGKPITEFNLTPYDAICISNNLLDSSIIARISEIVAQQKESE